MAVAKTKEGSMPEHILIPYVLDEDVTEQSAAADHLLLNFSQLARVKDPHRKNLDTFSVISFIRDAEARENIKRAFRAYEGVECHFLGVQELLFPADEQVIDQLLRSCKSATARVEVVHIMKILAILSAASRLGCSKVYLGDTCNRLAVEVIRSTCMGRGELLPWMLAHCQTYGLGPNRRIQLCRPLRDLVDGEVEHYLKLISERYPQPNVRLRPREQVPASVYSLSESFLSSMDKDNSATVSTVVRTASKVRTAVTEASNSDFPCSVCLGPTNATERQKALCAGCRSLLTGDNVDDHSRELLFNLGRRLI